jgi:hypothetical protein
MVHKTLAQRPVGRSFGIQELRKRQQITDPIVRQHYDGGGVGILADARFVTRLRR